MRGNSPMLANHDGALWALRHVRLWLTTLTNYITGHSIKTLSMVVDGDNIYAVTKTGASITARNIRISRLKN